MIHEARLQLPWQENAGDAARFRQVTLTSLGVAFVLGMILPWLPVADIADYQPELPARMAKLVVELPDPPEKKPVELPPPPPPPERVVESKPEPKPEPKPVVEEPVPEPPKETARERAEKSGVMAFADQLADLRQASTDSLSQDTTAATGSAPAERSLITSSRRTSSGGINTAALSRNTGGTGLEGRETTRVASALPTAAPRSASDRRASQSGQGARSREEIELVFDKNKAAIYSLYRRALRADPSLQGKVVLSLTIAPDGKVTKVDIVSSELSSPDLEARLVRRVRMFDFGAKDVSTTTTTKPIDFFPA